MARNANSLFLSGALYSRSGKALNIELDKRGYALGLITERAVKESFNKKFSKKKTEVKKEARTPKSLHKLEETKGPAFSIISREEREKLSQDQSAKPCVGRYTVNHEAVEKYVFQPFFGKSPKESSPRNDNAMQNHRLCDKLMRNLERSPESIEKIKATEMTKLQEHFSRSKDDLMDSSNSYMFAGLASPSTVSCHHHHAKSRSVANLANKPSPKKISSGKLGYKVKQQYSSHHVIDSAIPQVEPNSIPEKPRAHHLSVDFAKLSRIRHHYEDCPSPNENRFENIDRLPPILTNSKHVSKCDIGRASPRRMVYPKYQVPCIYNPNKESVLRKNTYCNFIKGGKQNSAEICGTNGKDTKRFNIQRLCASRRRKHQVFDGRI